jgi:4,5-DOPA dioxygenase extradiol
MVTDACHPMNACPRPPSTLPALFVSHGSPLFALEPGTTGPALTRWAQGLPQTPRAVVLMSPHWMAPGPRVMTHPNPPTWHDFGGFPRALYDLQYPAPGSPSTAQRVLQLLQAAGLAAEGDAQRPLDHGAWVPLMHLFPRADVPVVQVALPARGLPQQVWALGRALRPLRDEGVLIMGSGSMTHNLAEFFGSPPALDAPTADYVQAFARWVEAALVRGDHAALLDYVAQAPAAGRAHPSDEHFLPLLFALGAAGDVPGVAYLSREVMHGLLAMDALALD